MRDSFCRIENQYRMVLPQLPTTSEYCKHLLTAPFASAPICDHVYRTFFPLAMSLFPLRRTTPHMFLPVSNYLALTSLSNRICVSRPPPPSSAHSIRCRRCFPRNRKQSRFSRPVFQVESVITSPAPSHLPKRSWSWLETLGGKRFTGPVCHGSMWGGCSFIDLPASVSVRRSLGLVRSSENFVSRGNHS